MRTYIFKKAGDLIGTLKFFLIATKINTALSGGNLLNSIGDLKIFYFGTKYF